MVIFGTKIHYGYVNDWDIAKNLLGLGADADMISKATGLSKEDIKAL